MIKVPFNFQVVRCKQIVDSKMPQLGATLTFWSILRNDSQREIFAALKIGRKGDVRPHVKRVLPHPSTSAKIVESLSCQFVFDLPSFFPLQGRAS